MKLRILGSGTSTGVPEVGCTCPVCTSTDPRDNRLRASSLIHTDDAVILIDCGPDFREQMIFSIRLSLMLSEGLMTCARSAASVKFLFIRTAISSIIFAHVCHIALLIKNILEFRVFI